jgi:cobalt-zinc-cadmium efflux system outer membrane protein
LLRVLTARRSYFETNLAYVNSLVSLRQADVAITGLLLTGGLDDVPDAGGGNLQGVGLRDEALSGQ